ncbi:MAG: tetratricopeptide repeat protein [Alphaproteobacteria bacterium]
MDDARGVATSSSNGASLAVYERALAALNVYRGDPVAIIDKALEADPDFVMGHVLRAQVQITMWERGVLPAVAASAARLDELGNRSNDRERRHARAIKAWAAGDWEAHRATLDRLQAEYPRDLLALQIGHVADFFHGDRDNLRGRVARALPAWSAADRGYGFLLGMHAFGLEECGGYGPAEETGRHAIELEPDDCWAQHALAHVMEMQARQAEGIALMESRQAHWAQADNGFAFHNWWHTALYNLDQGNVDRALAIYDAGVRPEPTEIRLTMLDAAALLWRMHLRGIEVGGRWGELAGTYERGDENGFYAFNDMHAMIAFVATGKTKAAKALLKSVERSAEEGNTNGTMAREVGLPIVRAIEASGRAKYAEVIELLMPVRYRAHIFGGSHAQRDIVHRTLIEAALRAPDRALAKALTNERTAQKPHCPFAWQLHKRAHA